MEKPDLYSSTLQHHNTLDGLKGEELLQPERAVLDRTVWRKLDMSVLPVFAALFLFTLLERSNTGNALAAGLRTSLAMSNYQFTMALVVTSLLGMIVQFPCNLLVKYVGPDILLPAVITVGGLVSASQGLVHNYSEFLACRFLLGICQGGILPMIVLCLSYFYPPKLLQKRIATFVCMALLTVAFSGLLAAAIVRMDGIGGKRAWAWIFIMEGLFAVVAGVVSFFLIPHSPEKARFLTEEERAYVVSILAHTSSVSENSEEDKFTWVEVIKAAKSPHVWLLAIVFLFLGTIQSGFAVFLPTIVAGLGHGGSQVQLMSAAPFATAFVLVIVSVAVSDHYQRRGPTRGYVMIFFALFMIIGFTMYLASSSSLVGYASLFFSVPGAFSGMPASIAWLTNNSAPHTRRATAVVINLIQLELGGLFSLFLLGYLSTDRKHVIAMVTFIVMSIGILILSASNWIYLQRENRLKAERRQRMRKEDERNGTGDRSAWFIYDL